MKRKNLIPLFFTGLFLSSLAGSASVLNEDSKNPGQMPDNVKAIIDKSCFGCHNTDSQNEEAKKDLDFKTFDELSKVQKIGRLKHISDVVEKGEMPPSRFLERFPDRKLSDEEVKTLTEWVKTETSALIGN